MCGRFLFADDADIEEINSIIKEAQKNINAGLVSAPNFKTGEIFPTNCVPIVAKGEQGAFISVMRWGFPMPGKKQVINARSETASEKRMFSASLQSRRCVVASTGFYEWTHVNGKAKDKLLFREPGMKMLYMAAIAAPYRVKDSEKAQDCFVILTREANSYMSEIHDRMPVILHKTEIKRYLFDDGFYSSLFERDDIALEHEAAL
jgi:putative SOS response-associated peptidase YedK